jgi:murein L,D-transpeptidase YafK
VSLVRGADAPDGAGTAGRSLCDLKNPRVVVLKSKRRLHLFDGDVLLRTYPMSLGSHPVGAKLHLGDGRTPEGVFRICSRKRQSEHHRFLGIDYPNAEAARRGLESGLLTGGEAAAILEASDQGRCPPWTTALGGAIGIHGHGTRGPAGRQDWTAGCIALSDEHVEELFAVLRIGDVVEILP